MSEEFRREPELNEAELEGVSGGARDSAVMTAKLVCDPCSYRRAGSCRGGQAQLAEYLEHHAYISRFDRCPFTPLNYKKG